MTHPVWRRYLRFWGEDVRADVDEELAFHIEMRTADNIAAGMPPEAARAEAVARFGDVGSIAGECRTIDDRVLRRRRRAEIVDGLVQDLRFAGRSMRRNPAFALVAVLTLAIGIGATTAIFGVVKGILLDPLPYPDADRLVAVYASFPGLDLARANISEPEMLDIEAGVPSLTTLAIHQGLNATLGGEGAVGDPAPERVRGIEASSSFFEVLGTLPTLGRAFTAEEDVPGGPRVVVLSDELWRRRYGADSSIVGRAIGINGERWTVIGVMPPSFDYEAAALITPRRMNRAAPNSRGMHNDAAVGRRRPGATVAQVRAEMSTLAARLRADHPDRYPPSMGFGLVAVPLQEVVVGDARPGLLVLLGATGLVLLVVCANVANILLARAERRQREIAMRIALGASRRRLLRQLLTESALLAVIGGAAGLGLAAIAVRALVNARPPGVPRLEAVAIDWPVAGVALVVALGAGLLFGLAPALRATRPDLDRTLRDAARGSTGGRGGRRFGHLLVAAEVALAVVVVVGAGLLVRSFLALRAVDPGFRAEHVATARVSLPGARYADTALATARFHGALVERVAADPGVEAAGAAYEVPLAGGPQGNWDIEVEGRPTPPGGVDLSPNYNIVTHGYLETLRIPVRRGRGFLPSDDWRSEPVVLVNETLARMLRTGDEALGVRVRFQADSTRWMRVVGVVADVRGWGLGDESRPQLYVLSDQFHAATGYALGTMSVVARAACAPGTRGCNAAALLPGVRRAVAELDPELALYDVTTMEQIVARSLARERFVTVLLGAFAGIALLLAAVGIYGVMSYAVSRRTHEMGVRVALGARPADVRRLVIGEAMVTAAAGVVAGTAVALAATRLLRGMVYGVSVSDPATYAAIGGLLLATALLASWVPARRATRVEPMKVLREA